VKRRSMKNRMRRRWSVVGCRLRVESTGFFKITGSLHKRPTPYQFPKSTFPELVVPSDSHVWPMASLFTYCFVSKKYKCISPFTARNNFFPQRSLYPTCIQAQRTVKASNRMKISSSSQHHQYWPNSFKPS
jgi:hypothetical protein